MEARDRLTLNVQHRPVFVGIKTKEGREMASNLDPGAFNLYGPEADGQVGRIEKYLPDFFIQVPTYKKMS